MSVAKPSRNQCLFELTPEDHSLLRNHMSLKELRVGDVLHRCGDRIDDVVFPHSGVAVIRALSQGQPSTGIALIGYDGFAGGFAAQGSALATCDCEILIGGKASHIAASEFRYALDRSPSLRHWASRFDNALMFQAQQTAVCNAAHSVEARMCRWLLALQDHADNDTIPLTQGRLAELLGVRRTTVTLTAGQLEAAGALRCRRGHIQIVDRATLERSCCVCYARLKRSGVRPVIDAASVQNSLSDGICEPAGSRSAIL